MTGSNARPDRTGIRVNRIFKCPVCSERAQSLRILRVKDWRLLEGEFYHPTAICAGTMVVPGLAAAMDLLRLVIEANTDATRKAAA